MGLRNGSHGEMSDDSEIVHASAKGEVEVGVGVLVHGCDCGIGEYNLNSQ